MIKCPICTEMFEGKKKKWIEIIPGNEMAICQTCDGDTALKDQFKANMLKKIPKHVQTKAKDKQKELADIAKASKARNVRAKKKKPAKKSS